VERRRRKRREKEGGRRKGEEMRLGVDGVDGK
jgi:hypothetical protein